MGSVLDLEMVTKLLLASVLGALIGLEREVHGRPAGFRTHLLVSLGSCLFTIISIDFYRIYGNFSGTVPIGVDPGRIAAQVVSGIGFLGAGAIIREKASIRGLTTAACLWVAAAIGLSCGVGRYAPAIVVTLLSFASLLLLKKVENRIRRDTYIAVMVWSADLGGQLEKIEQVMETCQVEVLNSAIEKDLEKRSMYLEFQVRSRTRKLACGLADSVAAIEGVRKVRIE
jgi:putative Mg2+ transporter-C (MgtC) family protein